MILMKKRDFLICLLILITGCNSRDRVFKSPHFTFYYTKLDDTSMNYISGRMEEGYKKITADLNSGDLPPVNVHLYQNSTALIKSFPDMPSWAIGQATSASEIHMVTPNDPKQDYQNMIRNLIHEFAHCVSLKINPTIGNNPRWLWESVAIYEGNYPWDPHMLPYLVNQEAPPLDTLNTMSNTMIYQVGYFIAQYIDETYGKSVLKELIQNNGDLNSTLHMDGEEFRRKWFEFVKKKYGI